MNINIGRKKDDQSIDEACWFLEILLITYRRTILVCIRVYMYIYYSVVFSKGFERLNHMSVPIVLYQHLIFQ